jgi:hypothetical protein
VDRNGQTACGDEPLEYFEEWDGDAGDMATPLPCGEAFEALCLSEQLGKQPPAWATPYWK